MRLAGLAVVAGCTAHPPLAICAPEASPGPLAWVVDYGWHTEVIVPADQVQAPLAIFRTMFPTARTLSFGFGKLDFMTLPHPGFSDFVAGAIPGDGTIRVIPLPDVPARIYTDPVAQVPLTPAEWAALSAFLWRSFAHAPDGAPIPVALGNPTGERFFAASRGYSLAYTCNTWTVDALYQAGLPVRENVVFSGAAMRETALLRGACAPR